MFLHQKQKQNCFDASDALVCHQKWGSITRKIKWQVIWRTTHESAREIDKGNYVCFFFVESSGDKTGKGFNVQTKKKEKIWLQKSQIQQMTLL